MKPRSPIASACVKGFFGGAFLLGATGVLTFFALQFLRISYTPPSSYDYAGVFTLFILWIFGGVLGAVSSSARAFFRQGETRKASRICGIGATIVALFLILQLLQWTNLQPRFLSGLRLFAPPILWVALLFYAAAKLRKTP